MYGVAHLLYGVALSDSVIKQNIDQNRYIFEKCDDICAIRDKGDYLLIIAFPIGLQAYSLKKKTSMWAVQGNLPGMKNKLYPKSVCSGDAGHIYVVDSFNYMHLLTKDGIYVSTVVKEGDFGIGKPVMVSWLNDGKILVVLHEVLSSGRKKFMVSGIKLPF